MEKCYRVSNTVSTQWKCHRVSYQCNASKVEMSELPVQCQQHGNVAELPTSMPFTAVHYTDVNYDADRLLPWLLCFLYWCFDQSWIWSDRKCTQCSKSYLTWRVCTMYNRLDCARCVVSGSTPWSAIELFAEIVCSVQPMMATLPAESEWVQHRQNDASWCSDR